MEQWKRDFAETIAKHRRQGWGWRYDGLDDWTSERIFTQLQALGIDIDAERFRQQAAAAGGIEALRKHWDSQIREEMDTAFWPDFPLIAVPVLWERLTPDLVCPEIIDERLHRAIKAEKHGMDLPDVDGFPATVAAAVGVAKYLEGFPTAERAKRFDELSRIGFYGYGEWVLNLVATRGKDYPEAMIRIADAMADCDNGLFFQEEAAMLTAAAGRRDEAIERARALVDKSNDKPWARILAGDVLRELGDIGEAKRLYAEAQAMASDAYDRQAAAERLETMCKEPDGDHEPEGDLQRHPVPSMPVSPTASPKAALAIPTKIVIPPSGPKKVGRNDPCPCGSGKKYKRCCLR